LKAYKTLCEQLGYRTQVETNVNEIPKKSIISYAQNFEDVMLWRALGQIEKGFYIDIGAQDPIIDSVSKAFYENGWRGLHIEATPYYAELLRQDRPDEQVLQVAVSDTQDPMTFYEIPSTGISTGIPAIAHRHQEANFSNKEIIVPCKTLYDIFLEFGKRDIHWLKIDVEGMEKQVLLGWGEAISRPWVIVIESTLPLTQIETYKQWEFLLLERGYRFVYFDGLNRFYVSNQHLELVTNFLVPPNVFDGFILSGLASNVMCSLVNNQ